MLQVEEQKRRAEADKLAAITALEQRSREFMREKEEKRRLETRIANMQSQLLIGGSKLEDTPVFRCPHLPGSIAADLHLHSATLSVRAPSAAPSWTIPTSHPRQVLSGARVMQIMAWHLAALPGSAMMTQTVQLKVKMAWHHEEQQRLAGRCWRGSSGGCAGSTRSGCGSWSASASMQSRTRPR